jgi:iron complex transport system permease protein
MNRLPLIFLLSVIAALSVVIALSFGSISASPTAVWASLMGNGDPVLRDVLIQLRWPRAMAAFGTGAALAVAGVMMQVLLRNPLADPYILGTSGGAAVAALGAMTLGLTGLAVDSVAFAGALLSTLLVFTLANTGIDRSPGKLLLTGVVIAAGWGAAVSLMLSLATDTSLRGMLFWLMGDFSFSTQYGNTLIVTTIAVVAGIVLAPTLNLLATGDQQATLLGVNVKPIRNLLYFLSSLLTALAVTTAGTVGFVGLVIPHLVRLAGDADHRTVVPCSALAGGSLLVISDTVARTIIAPLQLPVGAITAMVGVPLFLMLLRRMGTQQTQ